MTLTERQRDAAYQEIRLLVRENLYDEALEIAKSQVETWPESDKGEAWHNLAYVLCQRGNLQDALNAISNALALDPDNPSHRDARAWWGLDAHRYDIVIEECTALLEIERARESIAFVNAAYLLRGFANLRVGNAADALRDFEQLTDEGPFHVCRKNWRKAELIAEAHRVAKEK